MFFDDLSQIPTIASKTNVSIFGVAPDTELNIKNAIYIRPVAKEKGKDPIISIDAVREILELTSSKSTTDQFFIIAGAETMAAAAVSALLKTLEEPQDHIHFILLTKNPSALLSTILSRAQVYYLRPRDALSAPVDIDEEIKSLAKQLITARPTDLISIAESLSKRKDSARTYALSVVATAIELLYKSYFATGNTKLLAKLPKLITLYDNLNMKGHIKLHIVADML